jgi:hypothetical protein
VPLEVPLDFQMVYSFDAVPKNTSSSVISLVSLPQPCGC